MAVSPDLLPISACAVGIVERRWSLAIRATRALAVGLATTTAAACLTALVLRIGGQVEEDLVLADTVLGPSLTTLGPGTVAVSVTTVPAAAYVGDAIALGRTNPMSGALLVLLTNVAVILLSGAPTLWVQRRQRVRTRDDNLASVCVHPLDLARSL